MLTYSNFYCISIDASQSWRGRKDPVYAGMHSNKTTNTLEPKEKRSELHGIAGMNRTR